MVEDFKAFDQVLRTWSEKLELFVCPGPGVLEPNARHVGRFRSILVGILHST